MKHYVYELRRPDGETFYVGLGVGDRLRHHRRNAERGEDSFRSRAIRSMWASGVDFEEAIVGRFENRKDACALEIALIAKYGRRDRGEGPLVNHTDGGEGCVGRPRTARNAEALRSAHLGAKRSPEAVERMRAAWTEERRATHVERCKARPTMSEHQRALLSAANKGRVCAAEDVERRAAKLRGRKQTPEQRAKSGAGVAKSWSPERRLAQAERMRQQRAAGL